MSACQVTAILLPLVYSKAMSVQKCHECLWRKYDKLEAILTGRGQCPQTMLLEIVWNTIFVLTCLFLVSMNINPFAKYMEKYAKVLSVLLF